MSVSEQGLNTLSFGLELSFLVLNLAKNHCAWHKDPNFTKPEQGLIYNIGRPYERFNHY